MDNVTNNDEELKENDPKSVQIEIENGTLNDTLNNTKKLNELNMLRIPEFMSNNDSANNRIRSKSFRTEGNSSATEKERRYSHDSYGFNKNYHDYNVSTNVSINLDRNSPN